MLLLLPPALLFALLHVYLWRRLVYDTRLSRASGTAATLLLIALCMSFPAAVWVGFRVARSASPLLTAIGFGWLSLIAYLITFLVIADAVRAARFVGARLRPPTAAGPHTSTEAPRPNATNITPEVADCAPPALEAERATRRLFMTRAVVGSALAASGGIVALGARSAVWEITTPELPVRLARFPRALDGYTIALLSDVHIGPMLSGRFLRNLVEQCNRMRPDLIAISGDLVDGRVREIGAQIAELRHLRARHGTFFVTGNHEYNSGVRQWVPFLEQLGIRVLMNEHVTLGDATRGGARFDLAGVPDHKAGPDVDAATLGRDPERELIMLAHQPVQIAESARVGVGLQLSGHTHGGQLLPFGAIALLDQPYLAGLHRHAPSETQIYVSCGSGFWGPPIRVLAPAEITCIRLTG